MPYDEARAKASGAIEEDKITFTLKKLSEFEEYTSEILYLRGQPWLFKLKKNGTATDLGVFMHLKNIHESDQWAIITNTSMELLSSNSGRKPSKQKDLEIVFTPKRLGRGYRNFIKWEKLVDPSNGYINGDECTFEILVRAGPFLNVAAESGMEFETIRKCCDSSPSGKFRSIIFYSNDFQAACSPTFILCNMPWRISVFKWQDIGRTRSKSSNLRILLQNLLKSKTKENDWSWSCYASMSCKLISSSDDSQSLLSEIENADFRDTSVEMITMVDWAEFIQAEKGFIANDKFTIEVELNFEETKGIEANIGKKCCLAKLECAICLNGLLHRSISSPKCGHMFCKQCIEQTVQANGECPLCSQTVEPVDLRTMYLPLI